MVHQHYRSSERGKAGIIIIIIIIITNFYTGLKNPSVCNTVVLGVLSKIINK